MHEGIFGIEFSTYQYIVEVYFSLSNEEKQDVNIGLFEEYMKLTDEISNY